MTITITMTWHCEMKDCTDSFEGDGAAADTAGWTYAASSYGVNSGPTIALRCPAHKGQ
jgi:hypothetical protein